MRRVAALAALGVFAVGVAASPASAATPTFVGVVASRSVVDAGSQLVLAVPAGGVAAGDTVIVVGAKGKDQEAVASVTDSRGNVYRVDRQLHGALNTGMSMTVLSAYVATALLAGDSITIQYEGAAAYSNRFGAAYDFAGLAPGPFDSATDTGTYGSAVTTGTTPSSQDGDLVFGLFDFQAAAATFTPEGGPESARAGRRRRRGPDPPARVEGRRRRRTPEREWHHVGVRQLVRHRRHVQVRQPGTAYGSGEHLTAGRLRDGTRRFDAHDDDRSLERNCPADVFVPVATLPRRRRRVYERRHERGGLHARHGRRRGDDPGRRHRDEQCGFGSRDFGGDSTDRGVAVRDAACVRPDGRCRLRDGRRLEHARTAGARGRRRGRGHADRRRREGQRPGGNRLGRRLAGKRLPRRPAAARRGQLAHVDDRRQRIHRLRAAAR